jgi:hypothetical protein
MTLTYTESCRAGKVLLVAVALSTGKRIATASYEQSAVGWQLVSAKGPANRVLKPGVERLIHRFARHIPKRRVSIPTWLTAAETNHEGNNDYATQEALTGVSGTSATDYIGTYTPPAAYLTLEDAYGEIDGRVVTRAAHAGQ